MKRHLIPTFLACGAVLMAAPVLQAQPATPAASPAGMKGCQADQAGGIVKHLTSALSLSSTQQAQVSTILNQATPQFKALQTEMQAQRKALADAAALERARVSAWHATQAKRQALVDSVAAKITPVLTVDQQAKFAELVRRFENRQEHGAEFAHRGPFGPEHGAEFAHRGPFGQEHGEGFAHRGPLGPHHVLQFLTSKLNLTTDEQSKVKPILFSTHSQISSIWQNASLTKEQKIAQMKQAIDASQKQIDGVLTPAQQQQLSALRTQFEQHHHHGPGGEGSSMPGPTNS